MKKLQFLFFTILFSILTTHLYSQEECNSIQELKIYSDADLKVKWNKLRSTDSGIKVLYSDLKSKGFEKFDIKGTNWGFKGITQSENKIVDAEFFAFDFINKSKTQLVSLIYRKLGKNIYKDYIFFSKGHKDFFDGLDTAEEYFVDGNDKIQIAQSWRKCFKKCVFKKCPGWCGAAIPVCATATAVVVAATGGATFGAAVGMFAGCAGISCGICMATCAIGCE